MMPAAVVSLLVMASLILGFFRDGLVAYYFGADWHTDLYFLALLIPLFIENSLAASMRDTLVVAFFRAREKGQEDFRQLAAQAGAIVLLGTLVIVLVLALTGDFWVSRFGGDWMQGHGGAVSRAYQIGILMIGVTLWSYYQASIFHAEQSFVWPAWRSVFFNLGGVLVLGLVWRSVEGLLAGMLLGQVAHILLLQRYLSGPAPALPSADARGRWMDLLPGFTVMISVSLFMQFAVGVERLLASWTGIGELSRLSFAFRVASVPLTLFTFSVIGISYARFARMAAASSVDGLRLALVDAQRGCLFLLVPVAVLMYGFAETELDVLLHRGAFHAGDIQRTALLMKVYAVGLPAAGMGLVIMRFLAAVGEFRRLLLAVGVAQAMICLAYAAFYQSGGAVALATVTTVGAMVQCMVLWLALPQPLRVVIRFSDQLALILIIGAMAVLPIVAGSGLSGLVIGCVAMVLAPLLVTSVLGIRTDLLGSMLRTLGRFD